MTRSDIISMHNEFAGSLDDWGFISESELNLAVEIQEKSFEYRLGPAVGWQVLPNFRVGASLFVVYSNDTYNDQIFSEVYLVDNDFGMLEDFIIDGERMDWSFLGFSQLWGFSGTSGAGSIQA